jgi:hypothetical protein
VYSRHIWDVPTALNRNPDGGMTLESNAAHFLVASQPQFTMGSE